MSHVTNVFSPPGTPLADRTVGEIVAERPSQSRIFQAAGLDFCCQGGKTLRAACERKGIALDTIVEQLEAELKDKPAPAFNPADLRAGPLVDYIVKTHHQYMKDEMPRIHAMSARVAQVHGGHTPSLVEVFEIYQRMAEDMSSHMMKEEGMLFPAIKALDAGEKAAMPLDGPVAAMMHEHEDAGADMEKIRELTNGFIPPPEACNTYRALFAGLAEMETDLHRHIHLENAVLFPTALGMAEKSA